MNHDLTIEKVINMMICSPQKTFTGKQLADVVRSSSKGLSQNHVAACLQRLKRDKRIKKTQVSKAKIYYQYAGML